MVNEKKSLSTPFLYQVVQPHLTKMSDRKAELERKKAKLAQIRAEKEARRKERETLDAQSATQVQIFKRLFSNLKIINFPQFFKISN